MTQTLSSKSFFAGKNSEYSEFFRQRLKAEGKLKGHSKKSSQALVRSPQRLLDERKQSPLKQEPKPIQSAQPNAFGFIDEDDNFGMNRRNEFDTWHSKSMPKEQPALPDQEVKITSEKRLSSKQTARIKKKISKLKRQRNLLHQKTTDLQPQAPEFDGPYYDFQTLNFEFTPEELRQEPAPHYMWIHMSCMYWIPEIYFNNSQFPIDARNLKGVEKEKFKNKCSICQTSVGACVSCSTEGCDVKFHVECARRANVHLEMVTEYQTKFNIHCTAHTPRLLSNLISANAKKNQEEVVKFYKYVQRLLRSCNVPLHAGAVVESVPVAKPKTVKALTMLSIDDSDKETEKDPRVPKQKLELCQIAKFLSEKSKLVIARVRRFVLQRQQYQFIITLKKKEDAEQEYEYVGTQQPQKLLYKNFVHNKDKMWSEIRKSSRDSLILHDTFKALVRLLKIVKANHNDYFRRDEQGNLVQIKSIEEGDHGFACKTEMEAQGAAGER